MSCYTFVGVIHISHMKKKKDVEHLSIRLLVILVLFSVEYLCKSLHILKLDYLALAE